MGKMNDTTHPTPAAASRSWPGMLALLAVALPMLAGCAAPAAPPQSAAAPERPSAGAGAGSAYGIRLDGLHLSAHGYILDLRYRVLDPDKAAPLLDAKKKVQLIDGLRDAKLGVPESPVIGGMRQTSRNRVIYTDRDYFVLFVNPGRAVRSGETLDLAVDGVKIAQVTVE
jgi:hypothetical protein